MNHSAKQAIFVTIGLILSIVALVYAFSCFRHTNYRENGPMAMVINEAPLNYIQPADSSLRSPKILVPGETVRFLGYYEGVNMSYLVETSEGFRGAVKPWALDIPLLAIGDKRTDTVYNLCVDKSFESDNMYGYFKGDTARTWLTGYDYEIEPAIKDAHDFRLAEGLIACRYITRQKFESEIMGKSHRYIAEKFSPLCDMGPVADGFVGECSIGVFDPETGFYNYPVIKFNADTLAEAVDEYIPYFDSARASVAKDIPFMSEITNMPLTSFAARDDVYDTSFSAWWLRWLFNLFKWCMRIFWCVAPVAIPALLFSLLLYNPLARVVPNCVVSAIIILLSLAAAYYWTLVMVPFQVWWWCILIIAIENICVGFIMQMEFVGIKGKHTRCPKCRHMYTIKEYDRDVLERKTEIRWTTDIFYDDAGSTLKSIETEVTTVSDDYGNSAEVRRREGRTYEVRRERARYKEKWEIRKYKSYRRCSECGFEEVHKYTDEVMVERVFAGYDVKYENRTKWT